MKKLLKPLTDKSGEARSLTREDMHKFKPTYNVDPALVAAHRAGKLRTRGRPAGSDKTATSLRLDNDVLDFFKSKGAGWQTRINDALRAIVDATR